jgi:hypothetical protein
MIHDYIKYKTKAYTVIKNLGLGEISTKHAVDDFLLGYIETKVWVCNKLDFQTHPGDVYLFYLLIL